MPKNTWPDATIQLASATMAEKLKRPAVALSAHRGAFDSEKFARQ
jgi:hypothetical protein